MKFIILLLLSSSCFAGDFIDTVYAYKFGTNVDCGQDSLNFPKNIFGAPSPNASLETPAAMPSEVLCLGFGGEIVVGLKDKVIFDEAGIDFKIFENAFVNPINSKIFAEPGIVSVSQDGINYIPFPYNFETLEGCAGITPVLGTENPFDVNSKSGDGFDLKSVGLTWAKYIKIKDITNLVFADKNHYYYDFVLSGFDLDAVAIINAGKSEATSVNSDKLEYSINGNNFISNQPINLAIYDLNGIELYSNSNCTNLNLSQLNSNFLILKVTLNGLTNLMKYINLEMN